MFAINKKTGRLITYQEFEAPPDLYKVVDPESFKRSDDGAWECNEEDLMGCVIENLYDAERLQFFMDDSYECCTAKDIKLVKSLPRGYDKNGNWTDEDSRTERQ